MNRTLVLSLIGLATIVCLVVLVRTSRKPTPQPPPAYPVQPVASTNVPALTNTPTVATQPVPSPAPAEQLPSGWQDFRGLTEHQQLNRITEAMENHTLPADLLAFFEKEIFNRKHLDVTRNNMANALVWQEQPNPQLHLLFSKMLEDETESPVWRDYCLQFLSECLASSADPDAIKSALARYSKGKDGLAGTAIVQIGFQEGKGRLQPDESFSQQLEQQLADPEVVTPTKLSILGMIGKRQDVRLLPLVRTYASDTNDSLRRTAIATLGLIGTREDLPLIQAGLTNANRAVQLAAKAAVERVKGRGAAAAAAE